MPQLIEDDPSAGYQNISRITLRSISLMYGRPCSMLLGSSTHELPEITINDDVPPKMRVADKERKIRLWTHRGNSSTILRFYKFVSSSKERRQYKPGRESDAIGANFVFFVNALHVCILPPIMLLSGKWVWAKLSGGSPPVPLWVSKPCYSRLPISAIPLWTRFMKYSKLCFDARRST